MAANHIPRDRAEKTAKTSAAALDTLTDPLAEKAEHDLLRGILGFFDTQAEAAAISHDRCLVAAADVRGRLALTLAGQTDQAPACT
jgi:hypothetical protein